ncbi:MAG: hypothetical protein JXC32_18875 [Anaerolineae bacterium]|nr:hypothetical protein [Anaerolineae bacterium]
MQGKWMKIAIAGAAMLTLLACSFSSIDVGTAQTGPLESETVTVEAEGAEEVRVTISMGAGELEIDGGAQDLLEAEFTYNIADWEPEVSYEVSEDEGRLTVRQPNTNNLPINSRVRYEWDLRFAEGVPLDMRIEGGAGRQDIDLAGLEVTDLDIRLGAGDAEINLSNNPALSRFDLNIGAGETRVDLNGPWDRNADIDIQGGVGRTELLLPRDVGVRVEVSRGIGDVDASGLYRQGSAWVNDAFGESDVTLEVRIQAGIGSIELDVRE